MILSITWFALEGCAGRGGKPPPTAGGGQVSSGTVDFATEVQPIFNRNCSCHTTLNPQGGLVLKEGLSFGALVGVASTERPQILRVKPGDPEGSYLFLKVDPSPASQGTRAGDLMPLGLPPLGSADVETIRRWIAEGAAPAAPKDDRTPPVFGGALTAAADGPFAVVLTWSTAADDKSSAGEISYLVYRGSSPGGEDFSRPDLQTAPGALSARVDGLEPKKTYYFVVRAMDSARNADSNRVEVSATTADAPPPAGVDFDTQVLPILRSRCLGCHGGDLAGTCAGEAGLCFDGYDSLARTAINGKDIIPGDSAASELVKRIRPDGSPRMPLDGPPFLTGEEIQLIASWVDQGANRSAAGGNRAPVASAGGPYFGHQGEPIALASPVAFDPDDDALTFSWDFGDGSTGEGRFPWHAYDRDGLFTVTLKASDGHAVSAASTAPVTVVAVTGDVPRNLALQRVCSRCHGLRVALEDGRRGLAAPPGQGFGFFPPGTVLDARARTVKSWKDTVLRMIVHGATPTPAERSEIETFLGSEYATADRRSEIFVARCAGCHTPSLAMVIPRSVKMWRETVDRMVTGHGASMTELERFSIAGYLGEVMEGPPPAALEPLIGQVFLNRTCANCHSPQQALDAAGLPRSDLRTYEGARNIAGRMVTNGCGQRGVMEALAARRLSEITTTSPDFLFIEVYDWSSVTRHLAVKAWSSGLGLEALTLITEDGRTFPMKSAPTGGGFYNLELNDLSPPPGRISVRSSGNSYLSWGGPLPQ